MANNKIIIRFSKISSRPSSPHIRSLVIDCFNSIDNVENYRNHNYDDNPGYAEADDLDTPLELIKYNSSRLFEGDQTVVVKNAKD